MAEPLAVVAATANPHKLEEMQAILGAVMSLAPRPTDIADIVEDAPTLVGNAQLKARAIAAATGRPAIADDTGLFVDAIDGEPGVHSARFAGENADDAANRALLLARLDRVELSSRTARFRTVIVLSFPEGDPRPEQVVEGACEGHIETAESGDEGFGYDSIFVPSDGDGRTFAQCSPEEKNAMSHRKRACEALLRALDSLA